MVRGGQKWKYKGKDGLARLHSERKPASSAGSRKRGRPRLTLLNTTIYDEMVAADLSSTDDEFIVSYCFGIPITVEKMRCLNPGAWLNSEVIMYYLELLQNTWGSKCHIFNTHFFSKLTGDAGYKDVLRWTRKIDVFSKDVLLVPINANNRHWYFASIDLRDKRTRVYDSLGGSHSRTHAVLAQYMRSEHEDKKKSRLPEDFKSADAGDVPQQHNSYDCGVFMLLGWIFWRGVLLQSSLRVIYRVLGEPSRVQS